VSAAEERLGDDPTSELWGEHRSRYRFAANLLAGQRVLDQRVLDVACGAGFGLAMLGAAARRAIGIDYDHNTLSEVQRKQLATLVRADATRLPLQTASFDVAVSFETIEHVADAQAFVHELHRVLKQGGRLVISTPNRAFGPPERHTANPFHVREFTAEELRVLLRERFDTVQLYGQRPSKHYRYVPFLMVGAHSEPAALAWKGLTRLPFAIRNRLALVISGRPFYPGETDYCFDAESTDSAHALLAVAQ
jgi:ubiquinone/menaquinone biosynthesis C-methylase UbiE